MDLNPTEFGYFVTQVALAAASFGVAADDLAGVGMALNSLFGYRCSQPVSVLPGTPAELQSICIDGTCPLAPNATCDSYGPVSRPLFSNATVICPSTGSNSTAAMISHPTVTPKGPVMSNGSGASHSFVWELIVAVAFTWII